MKKLIIEILKKFVLLMLIEFIMIGINVYLATTPSKILGNIIDLLYNLDANKSVIITNVYILIGVSIILLIIKVLWKIIDFDIARKMEEKTRNELYKKMLKADVANLQSMKNGQIMSYFVSDVKEIYKFLTRILTSIERMFLNLIIVTIAIFNSSNIQLTLISTCPIVISIIIILAMMKKLEKNYKASRTKFAKLSEFVQESTDSVRTTKAYVGGEQQYKEFLQKNDELKNTNCKVIKLDSFIRVLVTTAIGLGLGLFILYGGNLVINNVITIGDFVAVNGYLIMLQLPITSIPWLIKHTKKFKVSYKRLDKVFSLPEEELTVFNKEKISKTKFKLKRKKNKNENINIEKLRGEIEIHNLTYNYPNCIEKVLENINITVKPGQSLGIIGKIGSGKTTLMNLLLKLYSVPDNVIFIDGKDINLLKTDVIRNNICYITQDNFLFSASLKENINLFRDIYDEESIIESTKSSMIYDEIELMTDGINTVIGEKGIDLSGGQKQRVVISRAFLNKSNVVIFDDTFSALDNKTEGLLISNIRELTKNKTCIIISNRISDIKHCDEILVLEHGKIVERGVHSELIENKKQYYEFYKNQAEKVNVDILE